MYIYQNRFLTYCVLFYNEKLQKIPSADVYKLNQYAVKGFLNTTFTTIHIDLTKEENDIFSNFEKNTKYEINRALQKDSLTVSDVDMDSELIVFMNAYDEFAKSKNLPLLNRKELQLLVDSSLLVIRKINDSNQQTLVYHSYITTDDRARLLHSFSFYRTKENSNKSLIGRANRLLHWNDILYFKNNQIKVYDLGGIDTDILNSETQAINKFKHCFGGKIVTEYNVQNPGSIKGFIYLLGKKCKILKI